MLPCSAPFRFQTSSGAPVDAQGVSLLEMLLVIALIALIQLAWRCGVVWWYGWCPAAQQR